MSDYANESIKEDYQSPPRDLPENDDYKQQSRSRSRSPRRSRSRTPPRRSSSRDDRRGRSSSRSRSRDRKRRRSSVSPRRRSRSPPRRRSPPRSSRQNRDFHGTREAPEVSNILGVFGLSLRTRDVDIEDVFREFGPIEKVTVVYDHRSQRSRGFGFVYYKDQNDATRARDAMNGADVDGRKIRVDYSVTHRPHTPTPGEYMGERRSSGYDRDRSYRHSRHSRRDRDRSPRRRYRSRSRSWSR